MAEENNNNILDPCQPLPRLPSGPRFPSMPDLDQGPQSEENIILEQAPEREEYPFSAEEITEELQTGRRWAQRKYTIFSEGAMYHKKNFGNYLIQGEDLMDGHYRSFLEYETNGFTSDWSSPSVNRDSFDEFRFSTGKHWIKKETGTGHDLVGGNFLLASRTTSPQHTSLGIKIDVWADQFRRPILSDGADGRTDENLTTTISIRASEERLRTTTHGHQVDPSDPDPILDHVPWNKFLDFFLRGSKSYTYDASNSYHTAFSRNQETHGYTGGVIREGFKYRDYVFSAPAPFLKEEVNKIDVSNYDKASVELKINNFYENNTEDELMVPSIYKLYKNREDLGIDWRGGSLSYVDPCTPVRIQKFTCENIKMLKEINESVKNLADKYVEIKLSTPRDTDAGQALHDNRIDKYIMEMMTSFDPQHYNTNIMLDSAMSSDTSPNGREDHSYVNDHFKSDAKIKCWDRMSERINHIHTPSEDNWLPGRRHGSHGYPLNIEEYPLHYEGYDKESPLSSRRLIKFWDSIRSQIFLSKLDSMTIDPSIERGYKGIIEGQMAYSEVIGYKICKYDITNAEYQIPKGNNDAATMLALVQSSMMSEQEKQRRALQQITTPVQEFYLMNSDAFGELEFIDSQIISNKRYLYEIFTINMVFGTEYRYQTLQELPRSSALRGYLDHRSKTHIANWKVFSSCKPVIKTVPYFHKILDIVDMPPVRPKISFLPILGDDSHFKVLLEAATHQELEVPIKIFEEDQATIDKMLNSAAKREQGKILFQGDNFPTEYEVIKMTTLPSSYSEIHRIIIENQNTERMDFEYSNYQGDNIVSRYASNGKVTILTLPVIPNRKYYYVFRAVDGAGISNPTRIYEVRLVSYQNGRFLQFKEVEFADKIDRRPITLKGMLMLRPNFRQRTVNFDAFDLTSRDFYVTAPFTDDPDDPRTHMLSLSNAGLKSLWGRKFKLRVKSKNSHKSFDINFVFNEKKRYFKKPELSTDLVNEQNCKETDDRPPARSAASQARSSKNNRQSGSNAKLIIEENEKVTKKKKESGNQSLKDTSDPYGNKVVTSPKDPGKGSGGGYTPGY